MGNSVVSVKEPDVSTTIRDFIYTFVRPQVENAHIVEGWTRAADLQQSITEYVVYTVNKLSRKMTNIESYRSDGTLRHYMLVEAEIAVDTCSAEEEKARSRANSLANIARSLSGCAFFDAHDIALLYASDTGLIEAKEGEALPEKGYRTSLHISYYSIVTESYEGFQAVEPSLINVDVCHPPREE